MILISQVATMRDFPKFNGERKVRWGVVHNLRMGNGSHILEKSKYLGFMEKS